ncbi:Fpg/Nei family DNA glycosylase [Actinomyces minihominis]|uniref:Fpg/Nei family DNA glycosylase n=1 Tax=Actinomyces minihominis TaxID=2002838 RepID=UPI001F5D9144|nr:Fpg/Nei family DNA glycosylase [Actinomyces minihominis]
MALAFSEWFVGSTCETSSPQGRFSQGAARLNGMTLVGSESVGKHLFLEFEDQRTTSATESLATEGAWLTGTQLWLHVHLGLYGSWRFYGSPGMRVTPSIGAPRLPDPGSNSTNGFRVTSLNGEVPALYGDGALLPDLGDTGGDAFQVVTAEASEARGVEQTEADKDDYFPEDDTWTPPPPRGAVRLRIVTDRVAADLTGPTRCEVLDAAGVEAVLDRLGPDPLDHTTDPVKLRNEFLRRVRNSRRPIGELVMDQSVAAGVGNIYRAEALFRQGISPFRRGNNISEARLKRLWDDFVVLLQDGVTDGRIRTVLPELVSDEVEVDDLEAKKWFVYKRADQQCQVCGAPVKTKVMQGRNLFWCSSCQK